MQLIEILFLQQNRKNHNEYGKENQDSIINDDQTELDTALIQLSAKITGKQSEIAKIKRTLTMLMEGITETTSLPKSVLNPSITGILGNYCKFLLKYTFDLYR